MIIYTIGFTKKNAEQFFTPIKDKCINLLIDVRLNNKSQLAGFTKTGDIEFFLREICNCKYIHCEEYAPTKELLKDYQAGLVSWEEYETIFSEIMKNRTAFSKFYDRFKQYEKVCLLCSEPTPEHCHRRLVAEEIRRRNPNFVEIIHL